MSAKDKGTHNMWGGKYIEKYITEYKHSNTLGYLVWIHRNDLQVKERFETLEKARQFRDLALARCEYVREQKVYDMFPVDEYPLNVLKALDLKYSDKELPSILDHFEDNLDWLLHRSGRIRVKDKVEKIFYLRYKEFKTLQQVGDMFGITRERVRQLENKFMLTLKVNGPYLMFGGAFFIEAEREFNKMKERYLAELKYDAAKNFVLDYEKEHWEDFNLADVDIMELDLSVRTYGCLRRYGINKVSELIRYSPRELKLNIRGLGNKCVKEIREKLAALKVPNAVTKLHLRDDEIF